MTFAFSTSRRCLSTSRPTLGRRRPAASSTVQHFGRDLQVSDEPLLQGLILSADPLFEQHNESWYQLAGAGVANSGGPPEDRVNFTYFREIRGDHSSLRWRNVTVAIHDPESDAAGLQQDSEGVGRPSSSSTARWGQPWAA